MTIDPDGVPARAAILSSDGKESETIRLTNPIESYPVSTRLEQENNSAGIARIINKYLSLKVKQIESSRI